MGKGRQVTSTEIERTNFRELTTEQAMPIVAKLICKAHIEARERTYEFEASQILDGAQSRHQIVPNALRVQLVEQAEQLLEAEMMEEA